MTKIKELCTLSCVILWDINVLIMLHTELFPSLPNLYVEALTPANVTVVGDSTFNNNSVYSLVVEVSKLSFSS